MTGILRLNDTQVVHIAGLPAGTVAPRWNDVRVALSSTKDGPTTPPGLEVLRGTVRAAAFAKASTEDVFFDLQIPHGWVSGEIRPHIHWSPGNTTDTGVVCWRLDYSWASVGDAFPEPSTLTGDQAGSGTAYDHQIASFGAIDGSSQGASSVLLCRLYRDGANAADTFDSDAYALSVDVHLQIADLGSEQEYPGSS